MLIFSGPAASKRWQKKRALPVMQTLTAEASPVVPCCRRKGEVIPVGMCPLWAQRGFAHRAGSSRKEPGSHPPLEQHPTESHMLTCFFFFFFCWEHRGTTKSLLCFRWLEEVLFAVKNCCLQGFAPGLRELRHHLGISDAWELLGEGISDFSRCEVCSQ